MKPPFSQAVPRRGSGSPNQWRTASRNSSADEVSPLVGPASDNKNNTRFWVQPAHWARRLSFVREFARFRSATDPRTQIPPQGLLPFQPKRARPYLYSDEEIRSLLRAALRMPYRFERGKLRPWVYYCLFGLLSVSGLRLGEARNLELQDVDLKAALLTIRGAKFGKTRLVPLDASTCTVLAETVLVQT
jgi:integrase/recombinase XerD